MSFLYIYELLKNKKKLRILPDKHYVTGRKVKKYLPPTNISREFQLSRNIKYIEVVNGEKYLLIKDDVLVRDDYFIELFLLSIMFVSEALLGNKSEEEVVNDLIKAVKAKYKPL